MKTRHLAIIFAALSLIRHSASAKETYSRTIELPFADPRRSFDANTQAWYSLNQGFALGLDVSADKFDLLSRPAGRAALLGAALWSNTMLRYYSHELAHEYLYRNAELSFQSGPSLSRMTFSYVPGIFYPAWQKSQVSLEAFSDDQLLFAITGGLNQDEWNARMVWRKGPNADGDYYNALSYLLTKFRDVTYLLLAGSDERPFAPGQNIAQLSKEIYQTKPQLYDDVNLYRLALLNQGVEISNSILLRRALTADVLSALTWQSLFTLYHFIFNGSEAPPLPSSLPLVSYFLTPTGGFYHLEAPVNLQHCRLFISLGTAADGFRLFSQPTRIGVELEGLEKGRLHALPFVYGSFHDWGLRGYSIGVNAYWSLSRQTALWLQIQFHQNDILEDSIKGATSNCLRFGFRKTFCNSKGNGK